MSKHPNSGRKATSSFVDNDNSITRNHVNVTPRLNTFVADRSEHYAVGGLVSKSNLIGDSILVQDDSRSVAVSQTGEKYSIQLAEDIEKSPRNELYSTTSAKGDGNENSGHQHLTGLSPSSQENENKLNSKKRSKALRRHVTQKVRMTFTPRRPGVSQSMHDLPKSWSTNTNINAQTQTNLHLDVFPPRQIKSLNPTTNLSKNVSTPTLSFLSQPYRPTNSQNMDSSSMQQSQQVAAHPLERLQRPIPTKLCKKSNVYTENYADFHHIVSILTLVTVTFWFISTYFDIEILSELFDTVLQGVRNWYLGNAKPKTKMEIFMEFLTDLCTSN